MEERLAPGRPGIPPRWTSSAKEGIGTAYSTTSDLWFTLSHGIVNEIYFPHVDTPNTRDLQYIVTDGATFCHQEKSDLYHQLEYPEKNVLAYRITNSDPENRYRLVKELIAEAHSSVLLVRTRLEILDPALEGKLHLYVLLAPHLKGTGENNTGEWLETGGRRTLHAFREEIHLVLGCTHDFIRRSVGYVGKSDGWHDLVEKKQMVQEYTRAENGNIALLAEIDLAAGNEFTLAVAFGLSQQSASTQLLQALAIPYARIRERYVAQWKRAWIEADIPTQDPHIASLVRLSHCILLAHEDKGFPGAFVASLSIPWGETKDDKDRGGYHLVWTRDMVHTATALLAWGEKEGPLRALVWLAAVQGADGSLPQNSEINGAPYWHGVQLDEVARPILLAWYVKRAGAMLDFDPWTLVSRAAAFLIQHGPVTGQERWEENSGYSPSTLAVIVASLVCAADFARERSHDAVAAFLLDYADWIADHLDEWTATTRGDLVSGIRRHYLRITPASWANPAAAPNPNEAEIVLTNGGGKHFARRIVSGDFLQLVRLGVRDPHDPLVLDSIRVIDAVLKRDLPQGPCWRRYNFDGYGQKADGSAYDGTGEGGCWPILTGERGHYELAAGRDPHPYIETIRRFANTGGMIPEQVWDNDDLPSGKFKRGDPTGSAMPLCWSHAEFLTLVRSRADGICYDRPEPVYQRYVKERTSSAMEIWTFAHQLSSIHSGKALRIITTAPGTLHWSSNGWETSEDAVLKDTGLTLWFADIPSSALEDSRQVTFTFHWNDHWENRDYVVAIAT